MHAPSVGMQSAARSGAGANLRHWVVRIAWRTLAVLVLGVGVLLASIRLMLPGLEHYREEVETWISGGLGQRVTIGALDAYWDGWRPRLQVRDVRLIESGGGDPRNRALARFASVSLTIDPFASLRAGELRPANVTVTGASLIISRLPDGAISVKGLVEDSASESADTPDTVARLLLHQGQLELRSTRIVWVDERADKAPVLVSNVNLRLSNHDNLHQIRISGQVDGRHEGQLSLIMDLEGDLLTPGWSGQIFARVDDIDLAIAARLTRALGLEGLSGVGAISVWSDWQFANLQRAEGNFALRGVSLPVGRTRKPIETAGGRFVAERDAQGWTVELDRLEFRDSVDWPVTRISLRYAEPRGGRGAQLIGEIGELRLERVLPYVIATSGAGAVGQTIREAAPSSRITGLGFSFDPAAIAATAAISAEFSGFSMQAVGKLPSLANVRGRLEMAPGRGALWLRSGTVLATLPELFERPLAVDQIYGRLAWRQDRTATLLELDDVGVRNRHLEARITGSLRWRASESAPEFGLVVRLERGDLAHLSDYLPVRAMPATLVQWLQRAVEGGRLEDAELLFHGRPGDIPFDAGQGRLAARGRVSGVNLNYARGWPGIENLSADFDFDGRRAEFRIGGGTVLGSRITSGRLLVEDMAGEAATLRIDGTLVGHTEQGAAFLRKSPLGPRFNHFLNSVSVRGESELELSLTLPLRGKDKKLARRVSGVLRVADNDVDLPGLAEGLHHVNGAFAFDGGSVTADTVEADYLGQPIALIARPRSVGNGTRIEIAGDATRDYLAAHLHNAGFIDSAASENSPWLSRLHGTAHWNAVVEVPHVRDPSEPVATLRVTSDLHGARFDLPAPLTKPADTEAHLEVRTRFAADGGRSMQVAYHDLVSAAFELAPELHGYRLERGTIRFGGESARLVDSPGVLVHGFLPELPLGEWYAIVGALAPVERSTRAEPTALASVRRVDLGIGDLRAFRARFRDTRIVADRADDGSWEARVSGPALDGEITVPADLDSGTLDARFTEITIGERTEEAPEIEATIDPRSLPAFRFQCERCTLEDRQLGAVEISARPFADGSRFDRLSLRGDGFEVTGNGVWSYRNHEHASAVEATVLSRDLGEILTAFGYQAGGAQGGPTTIELKAAWPDTPLDFDLSRISGRLDFRANHGRLIEVEPGPTGRLFGLLTLTSLPRRLAFDFRDIFQEGLAYDYMEGSFGIHAGDAYTNNFVLESTTARIEIAGRTGLVDEDYDQVVTVTPKLSSSLPLAPIWLAEKILNKRVFDRVFAFRYTITGSWHDPVVERVVIEPPDTSERG